MLPREACARCALVVRVLASAWNTLPRADTYRPWWVLPCRYHVLHPEYIYHRFAELHRHYTVRTTSYCLGFQV